MALTKQRAWLCLLALCLALAIAACFLLSGRKAVVSPENLSQIKRGMAVAEVEARLGKADLHVFSPGSSGPGGLAAGRPASVPTTKAKR
jgi:hypothetical protein